VIANAIAVSAKTVATSAAPCLELANTEAESLQKAIYSSIQAAKAIQAAVGTADTNGMSSTSILDIDLSSPFRIHLELALTAHVRRRVPNTLRIRASRGSRRHLSVMSESTSEASVRTAR
jgi:hypothetical protein